MPTLSQALAALPHRDLRGIATRLNIRQRTEYHKDVWITAITAAWRDPGLRAHILAGLSPAAHAAAGRLAASGDLPAALFLAEYGPVRRPRPGQSWTPPPWAAPATVSEELYYCGLLAPTPAAPLEKARRLTLPADLGPFFRAAPSPAQDAAVQSAASPPLVLLHDVAQALSLLAEPPGSTLLHDRWLPPAALARLNARLLQPQPAPLPRTHARAHWPGFIFFLATAADLQAAGRLTSVGWDWLAQPPAAQLAQLWRAWRTAPPNLRQAYRQPTAALPPPWPDLALRHLARLPAPFTVGQLTQVVLGQERAYTAYFAAHLADISDLDAIVARLLATLAADWAALTVTSDTPAPAFQLTAFGRWLLAGATDDLPAGAAAPVAQLHTQADASWQLSVSAWAAPIHLARLAPYAHHLSLSPLPALGVDGAADSTPCHTYHLTPDAIAAAAAAGHGLPPLLAALTGLAIQLNPTQLAALQTWHNRGHQLEITHLPLLRAAQPEILAQLLGQTDLRAGLGDLLSPTVAIITLPPAQLAARLRAAGFYPQETGIRDQESGVGDQEPGVRGQKAAGADPASSPGDSANLQSAIYNLQSPAALWLAGQLYAALGQHTALPLPPPFPDLTALLASLPPLQQATVQAQWRALRAAFHAVLDGQTYALPPQLSDPTQWRPRIAAAIAAGRSLTMRYFTAGRNVITERTVTPYWIEEHHDIPYLRADCHLAGRVRLFRLDRIQEIQETGDRLPPDS